MSLRSKVWISVILSILAVVLFPQRTVYAINTAADLNAQIMSAPSGSVLTLTGNISLDTALNGDNAFANITQNITIDGAGFTITRDDSQGNEFRFFNVTSSGSLTLQNITLENGYVYRLAGGAIHSQGQLIITDSTFNNNTADDGLGGWDANGGAIYSETGQLTVTNSTFNNNTAVNNGGAISSVDAIALTEITDSTFNGNSSEFQGGAIYSIRGPLTVGNSVFTANTNDYSGGAIHFERTILTLKDNTFTGNIVYEDWSSGGAVYISYASTANIIHNTFLDNLGADDDSYGGALAFYRTNLANIFNNTFAGNSADFAGALELYESDYLYINNNTFFNNTARASGGIVSREDILTAEFNNNIFYGTGNACVTDAITGQNNLRSTGISGCPAGIFASTLINNTHLGSLADNGGNTHTIALTGTSNPAVNASIAPATVTDQRGVPAQGVRDIGAYESFNALTVEFGSTSATAVENQETFTIPLTILGTGLFDWSFNVAVTTNNPAYVVVDPVKVTCTTATCTGDVVVTWVDDAIVEADDVVTLTINQLGTAYELGANTQFILTVMDDDSVPMVVNVVDVSGNSLAGTIFNQEINDLSIQFNMDVFNDGMGLDPDSASNPANYILLREGAVLGFQTASCVAGVSPDDEHISFANVSYDSSTHITMLALNPALGNGNYQLMICGTTSIVSANNPALHLNNGVDVSVNFTIDIPTAITPTPIPTITPTTTPSISTPAQPSQPEDLGVSELPATGERPLWAELLARWLRKS